MLYYTNIKISHYYYIKISHYHAWTISEWGLGNENQQKKSDSKAKLMIENKVLRKCSAKNFISLFKVNQYFERVIAVFAIWNINIRRWKQLHQNVSYVIRIFSINK